MTPSEIADDLTRNAQDMRGEEYFRTADLLDQAAATIRELKNEAARKEFLAASYKSLADDCIKSMHKTEAKLKIATEAMEFIAAMNCGFTEPQTEEENNLGLCVFYMQDAATQALARIKEV